MFSLISHVLAQGTTTGGSPPSGSGGGLSITPPAGLPTDVCTLLANVTDFLLLVVAPLAGLMILWAAFQILTAAGDPTKFATGKRTIVYALIGLGVVILSKGIVAIIIGLLGASGGGSTLCP